MTGPVTVGDIVEIDMTLHGLGRRRAVVISNSPMAVFLDTTGLEVLGRDTGYFKNKGWYVRWSEPTISEGVLTDEERARAAYILLTEAFP
jgi:hypothetical protein